MESKHTQGEWVAIPDGNISVTIKCGDFKLATVTLRDWNPQSQGERNANARLIAACPELLAALEECVSMLDVAEFPEGNKCVSDARSAIAKAKAKAQS